MSANHTRSCCGGVNTCECVRTLVMVVLLSCLVVVVIAMPLCAHVFTIVRVCVRARWHDQKVEVHPLEGPLALMQLKVDFGFARGGVPCWCCSEATRGSVSPEVADHHVSDSLLDLFEIECRRLLVLLLLLVQQRTPLSLCDLHLKVLSWLGLTNWCKIG